MRGAPRSPRSPRTTHCTQPVQGHAMWACVSMHTRMLVCGRCVRSGRVGHKVRARSAWCVRPAPDIPAPAPTRELTGESRGIPFTWKIGHFPRTKCFSLLDYWGLKALRQAVRQSFGRIFGKQAASYVDSDMVSEGRSHVHRYRVDHLHALHQAFVTFHAKCPAPYCLFQHRNYPEVSIELRDGEEGKAEDVCQGYCYATAPDRTECSPARAKLG